MLRFYFASLTSKLYEVAINPKTGAGYAINVTGTKGNPGNHVSGATRIALQVDAGALSQLVGGNPIHTSYWVHAAVFNTAQRLSALLA